MSLEPPNPFPHQPGEYEEDFGYYVKLARSLFGGKKDEETQFQVKETENVKVQKEDTL